MLHGEIYDQVEIVLDCTVVLFFLSKVGNRTECVFEVTGNLFQCCRIWGLVALSASTMELITLRTLSDAFGRQVRWIIDGNSSPNLRFVPHLR